MDTNLNQSTLLQSKPHRLHQLSQRFVALDPATRKAFLARLRETGIGFDELPVLPADGPQPISLAQQGLWLTWQLDPHSSSYNMPGVLALDGSLDADVLEAALSEVQARHPALHSRIDNGTEPPTLCPVAPGTPELVDLAGKGAEDAEAEALRLACAFTGAPFALERAAPFRARLYRTGPRRHLLALALHHIAADGPSLGLIVADLVRCYEARLAGRSALPAPVITPGDYALWQRRWFEAGEGERQLAYWRAALGEEHAPLALPYDRPDLRGQSHPHACLRVDLPPALSAELRALARTRNASLYMAVQALLAWCLQRHTGQSDIRIGSPVANRRRPETLGLVAYLSNVLVLRNRVDETRGFVHLLDAVRATVLEAQAHADLPFDQLVTALQPERLPGVHPLFQVKCTEQDASPLPAMGGATLSLTELRAGSSHFDLSLDFTDRPDGILLEFGYAAGLFEASTIAAIADTFTRLADLAVSDPERALGDADRGSPTPSVASTGPGTVLTLWAAQVAARPDAGAVRCDDVEYSYAQLDRAANVLALRLLERGAGAERRVAIHAERSCEFVLGMLAALKAGACYVPLDPQLPPERLRFQLEDSGACLLLDSLDAPWAGSVPRIALDFAAIDDAEAALEPALPDPRQAAYLIYTSGSTGKPKAVTVPHGALAAYVAGVLERLDLDDGIASMAMVSTVAADLGHTTLYGALCSGRLLHLIPASRAFDPDAFAGYMRRHRVDVLKIVPSHLQALLAAGDPTGVLPARRLVLGGEATTWPLLERIAALRPDCRVLNHYGPSETTVGVLTQEAATASRRAALLPLGHPLPGAELHVLDGAMQPVPPGVPGELYIGGAGLARGYLGRPGLSAERFVASPFVPGARLYRSGDRVRRLADGAVEFLGRIDDQVKIRGYRVEPGEVSRALLAVEGVHDAFVLAREADGRMGLAAWVVADVDAAALKTALAATLPDYMLPSSLSLVERLPLTANGKVDRKALSALESRPALAPVEPPQGPVEETIASIWSALLKKEAVGRHDNFFELGGDSIISLQIVARLRRAGYKLAPKLIFEKQTVAQLAQVVLPLSSAAPAPPTAQAEGRPFPLTPIQADCLARSGTVPHHRNQSVLLRPRQPLDARRLEAALAMLLRHHGALRLRFARHAEGWTQRVTPFDPAAVAPLLWRRSAATLEEAESLYQAAQRSLDIETGPLLRAVLVDLPDGGQRLLLVVHHLAVDGVSWRILLEDLGAACAGEEPGAPSGSSFEDWAATLAAYPGTHGGELAWWRALADVPVALPIANPQGGNRGRDFAAVSLRLDAARTDGLLHAAPAAWRTRVNDLLLAALGRALCAWCGSNRILVALEGHGREDPAGRLDLSRTVGWFTSVFPVALAACDSPVAALKHTKEMLRALPGNGIGHGVLRHLGGPEQRAALAALPQPQVLFNYLGQFDNSFGPEAPWVPAGEGAGDDADPDAPRDYALEIGGQVHGGELALTIAYSATRFETGTMEALARRFQDELETLVSHCTSGESGLTPSDVPLAGLTQEELDSLPLDAAEVDDLYPLSPMQAGMLFHGLLAPDDGAYLNQLRLDIEGVDAVRLRQAWETVLERHAVLRTGFLHRRATPLQWVTLRVALPWREEDWRGQPAALQALALDALAEAQLEQGFELEQPPLMRLVLVRTGEHAHHLIWTNHHLLTDGWSTSQLLGDVLRAYQGETLDTPPGRYRDYIGWLLGRDGAAGEAWWRARLAPLDSPTRLAGAMPPGPRGHGHGKEGRVLGAAATRALQEFAAHGRVTVNTVAQAAWALLLARYTGQRHVCFGATTAGRPAGLPGAERMTGLFINTLPVICDVDPGLGLGPWLRRLQADGAAAREHETTPLVEIQRWAGQGGQALFDTLFVFENYPVDAALASAPGGTRFNLHAAREQTAYPLTLVLDLGERLRIEAGYDRTQFGDEAVRGLLAQWEALLVRMATAPVSALGEFQVEDAAGHLALLDLGRNDGRHANRRPVHTLFERQAAAHPEAPALLFGTTALSYAELNGRANRLAHHLIGLGVKPETRVGVALERSVEMVVALLAVMKAGGAYVPLDPEYPRERLAGMVGDSGIGLLLTSSALAGLVAVPQLECLPLDVLVLDQLPSHDPQVALHDEHLAYVIHTSGSTGRPKGAANRHGSLYNRLAWMQEACPIGPGDTLLQKTPFGFDVSVWEFFWPLMTGARLALAQPGDHREPARLATLIRSAQVSTLHFVPSMLQAFVAHLELAGTAACQSIRQVLCSGEALPAEVAARLMALLPHARLHNLYGPTEAAIDVTHYVCDGGTERSVAIGRPIHDTRVLVLDTALNLAPRGVAGELFLGGAGLARGYLGRPGLSAERFVADPFGEEGERLYRTGDLVRWRADGELEYLGRLDHQVKIRGLRIELGEIEACLLSREDVEQAVVVAREERGGPRLVAYVAPGAGDELVPAALKEALAAVLPDYMLPSSIVVLERLPLNPNGKVDRKALPAPEQASSTGAPPQGETEEALARIWAAVLGLESVGRDGHFFELGGHSLLALQLTARIEQELKISATLLDVFEAPTVMSYAQRLNARGKGAPTLDSLEAFIDSLE